MSQTKLIRHSNNSNQTYQASIVRVRSGLGSDVRGGGRLMETKSQKLPQILVGIIGGGYGVSTLLPAISTINEFRVVSVALSGNSISRTEHKDLVGSGVLQVSASEIIEDPLVNMVVIASPPSTQEKFAIAALENGKSIFCEKPAGLDVHATRRIHAAVNATGGFATIGYQFRYDPLIKWLGMKVFEGSLGKIHKVDVQWETSGAINTSMNSWRNDPRKGGGVLRDFASHIFDYMSVVDPSNFKIQDIRPNHLNYGFRGNNLKNDLQDIDFQGLIGSVEFHCRVSRRIPHPLGHKITIEAENGIVQVVHKTPYGINDMFAKHNLGVDHGEIDCTQELDLESITSQMEKYKLDLRQLAVRNLFLDFAILLHGGTAPNLPDFVHGISNQMYVQEVEKALFSK